MATTTPDAVIIAIEALIVGLRPAGADIKGQSNEYVVTGDRDSHVDWETRSEGNVDRHFQITEFEPVEFVTFGGGERDITANLVVQVGHIAGNFAVTRNRRVNDIYQLIVQLTRPANHDAISGLHAIFPNLSSDAAPIKDGKYVVTTLGFPAQFALSANYGGS